ncbi:hypothetical protein RB201_21790 [Streptomyces sp. S1A(2023)]
MKAEGFQSSFTVALQTPDDTALRDMDRSNMRLNEIFRYDNATRPIYSGAGAEDAELRSIDGLPHYVRSGLRFQYPMPHVLDAIRASRPFDAEPSPVELTLVYRVGFDDYLDNHELATYYAGRCLEIR